MSKPIVGHLDPFFFEVYEEIRRDLRTVFGTTNSFVQVISGTGSAGMETSLANFVQPGEKLAVFTAGFFADRIVEMGQRHGANVVRFDKPWGETASEAEAEEFLTKERPQAVAFVHAETSTGALQDPLAITRPAHAVGAVTIADCVTSLGALAINTDTAGIDVAFGCSQKGLSCPPGLSPITVSPAALERLRARKVPCPVWYMDLKLLLEYYEGSHRYHHTAPISSFYALREGLALAMEEGIERRFCRHQKIHLDFVRRMEAAGFSMFIRDEARRIQTINTMKVPAGVNDVAARKRLIAEYNIDIAGGFGPLAGQIFRIGLMGPLATPENVELLTGALIECIK
jgi:alanine-glyoxylate transaminase / serine-glyoxylate transaminase / serine-pyruvate transaminase